MLHYIIQTIAFQLFFLILYDVFFNKETFFNWNRGYLLATAMLSLIIPFIKISSFKHLISQDYIISLPEIFIGSVNKQDINPIQLSPIIIMDDKAFWSWEFIFYIGVAVATLLFAYKLSKLLLLLINNPKQREGNLLIVSLLKSNVAFSFFNYIFLGDDLKTDERASVLKHEKVHVKQRHTLDLLFFEVLRILFWFNPLVYMYQNRIMSLHEFIADAQAVKNESKNQYYQNLLSQVFQTKNISFINPFFKKSLIKKRIIMLQKSKSKQVRLIKYTILFPLILGMLIYSSCNNEIEHSKLEIEFTDEEIKDKLLEELNELRNSGIKEFEIYKAFVPKSKNYILTIEEHYRQTIFVEQFFSSYLKKNKDKSLPKSKTYTEYLQWKKTDVAKESWESAIKDGVLRLVVNDIENLTPQENVRKEEKITIIKKDYYFHALLITDGYSDTILKFKKGINWPYEDDILEELDVPFSLIDQVPTFPGCEGMTNEDKRDCMSRNISMHVNKNFNTKLANELNLTSRQRINVIFKIDKEGNIVDVRSRAPHPDLEAEAIRVIKTIPKMIPGKQKGKAVNVPYSLPIIFQVAE